MSTNTKIKITVYEESDTEGDELGEFISLTDDSNIYEARAQDLANILAYDKDHYSDVNIETLLRAAEIAGIIEIQKS